METQNHLIDARDRGFLDEATYLRLMNLSRVALKTTTGLLRSKQRQASMFPIKPRRGPNRIR